MTIWRKRRSYWRRKSSSWNWRFR